jgi:hypothetical protein
MAREKRTRITTPKGVAVFPWLNKPDTKWKPEGEYRVKVRIPTEAAQPLIDQLQPTHDAIVKESKAAFAKNPKNKGKKWNNKVIDFYTTVVDENGDETGEVEFNFKRRASGISAKTNEPWSIKPDLFDAKGKPLNPDAKVFGGSIVKVSFEVNSYDKPIGTGISLSLCAVQVIKLVEGQRSAEQYGFGNESEDDDADTSGDDPVDGDSDDAEGGEGAGDEF